MADPEQGTPLTTGTLFDIASVSKRFTATALLLLQQQEQLDLDDPLALHVGTLPPWADAVTLEQLMHHTSGIPDYVELLGQQGARLRDVAT